MFRPIDFMDMSIIPDWTRGGRLSPLITTLPWLFKVNTCHPAIGCSRFSDCFCLGCETGTWKHAGFHLTTSIAAPALLSLPFALRDLGWVAGILALVVCAGVSFYAYTIISQVLEYADHQGHRFLRFRDLGRYIFGM